MSRALEVESVDACYLCYGGWGSGGSYFPLRFFARNPRCVGHDEERGLAQEDFSDGIRAQKYGGLCGWRPQFDAGSLHHSQRGLFDRQVGGCSLEFARAIGTTAVPRCFASNSGEGSRVDMIFCNSFAAAALTKFSGDEDSSVHTHRTITVRSDIKRVLSKSTD